MSYRLRILLLLFLAFQEQLFSHQITLPRHPAPSPDGSTVAFSWQGDIWIVSSDGGQAKRLTAHPESDRYPVWSRDGKWIAFGSYRHGHLDVFIMPSDGNTAPRRLTFASSNDQPLDFTHDGQSVLFNAYRNESVRNMPSLYAVPIMGGTPQSFQTALGRAGAFSPDGSRLAFVRGSTPWYRSGYSGGSNRDIWLRKPENEYEQLTTHRTDDDSPMWISDGILFFISARNGKKNLYKLDIITREILQITYHGHWDVRLPRAANDGSIIAYEHADEVRIYDVKQDEERKLIIYAPNDQLRNPVEIGFMSAGATELAMHPDGKLAAMVIKGDIHISEVTSKISQEIAQPRTRRLTQTIAIEKDLSWSADGSHLLFSSDRKNNYDLYTVAPEDKKADWIRCAHLTEEHITASQHDEYAPRYSPDGSYIAYIRERGELMVENIVGGPPTCVSTHYMINDFTWSPDSRWLAYSALDNAYNSDVWITDIHESVHYNVSRHPDHDASPAWSPDGRRLAWSSKRHADTYDIWAVWLRQNDHDRLAVDWLDYWDESSQIEENENETAAVFIDFDDLWRRSESLTELSGDERSPVFSHDGRRILFVASDPNGQDLYSVRWDGKDLKQITHGDAQPKAIQQPSEGSIYYLTGKGTAARVSLTGDPGDPIPFRADISRDVYATRAWAFEEAWRFMEKCFYDPAFHGLDWTAQRNKYQPLALSASTEADFEDVMDLFFGELNASHVGYSRKKSESVETTGWLGAFFDPSDDGPGLLVSEVLKYGPTARHPLGLKPGDRVLSCNGTTVDSATNIYQLLIQTEGREISLEIMDSDGRSRRGSVVPISRSAERRLRYDQWSRERSDIVHKLSGGTLGYVHIRHMDLQSFEMVEHALYAAGNEKAGLLIDVRSNSGGWTTDYLLAVLDVRRHAYTLARGMADSCRAYPQNRLPFAAWTKPALLLCNDESFSNAEILSHAFQQLGRGLIVGNETFGGVISTGSHVLANGARMRLPRRGWFDATTGECLENNGVIPDVTIYQPPCEDLSATDDSQLEKAVEVLLASMPDDCRTGLW